MRILGAIALLAAVTLAQTALAQGRAAAVGVQAVQQQVFAETVPVFAQVVTARDGAVAGRISGNVENVAVLAGDRVEKGALIIELNAELLSIRLDQSKAQIAEAQAGTRTAGARVARAQVTFDRIAALSDTASFSRGRFEDLEAELLEARSQFAEAQAREKTAQARLAETEYQLERSIVAAPFSGVILEVLTIPGAFIQAGTPVVRMVDTDAFEVRANVPARYADALSAGTVVSAQTEGGREIDLTLRAVLPIEDPSTRTRSVLFRTVAPATGALVAVGQSLTLDIPIGEPREMLSVPKDALVQAQGGWTVFVAVDGKAQPRFVTIGVPVGDRYEVVSGLSVGDLVVVRGNERLRPMQDINATVQEVTQ
ncbi:efflux RND transporter periplasmic adaptor subunit [uncultured Sulfitobacter sp.]|uniref:efflux RND transporter periplasmic adaptor subunit n=1 Tax=uncultured Sulfitobacter sp. TaxID=191468 RepID=UPI002634B19A|nr:efflux RND transporter periplasmic adaptor subunit [uncultured Sulfitobacter sp.]